ncbi:hypothetical protein [Piscirickettsia salmonis]|uniref:hypothetical protein n=1 Tax=Piscirickettsia salmonis TaxID=1238 RepID=UPI00138A09DA|nr:hypothetical protein [Piscirickettsia salmonis]
MALYAGTVTDFHTIAPHYGGSGFLQGYDFYLSIIITSLIMYYLSSRLGDKKVQELPSSVSQVHTESHMAKPNNLSI